MVGRYARLVITAAILAFAHSVHAQCPNDNTYWQTTTPACPGSTVASTCLFAGEYQLINVVAGNTYTFSTCGTTTWDTQITLYNNAGGGSLGYNDDACGVQSSITWTATFTGQLRVLIDQWSLLFPCGTNSSCATLTVTCATPVVPPPGGCIYTLNMFDSFGDGWGTSNVGVSINGGPFQYYTVTGTNNSIPLAIMPGNTIVLSYNNSGAFQGENSYTLTLGAGAVFSSGSPPVAGVVYAGTLTCVPPPAPPEDCLGSITICNGQTFNNNTNNTGLVADLNLTTAGCLANTERQGTWYNFTISSSGQIGYTINPADPLDDYDFAIWGPFPPGSTPSSICPPLSAPLRCSYAAPSGATGLNFSAADVTEGAAGDKWVQYLNVTAGQVYLLYISNWSQSGLEFSLSWDLQGGASLDCTVLSADLLGPNAKSDARTVTVSWTTLREAGTASFAVLRSGTEGDFEPIGTVIASGGSNQTTDYAFVDSRPFEGLNRYRLLVTDMEGRTSFSTIASVHHGSALSDAQVAPNPAQGGTLVRFQAADDGMMEMSLVDPTGRTVRQARIAVVQGRNEVPLSVHGLAQGQYNLVLSADGAPLTRIRLAVAE